ncbi:hypothetical protein B4114_0244 [Geobacillus stearothermophilus]|uniref:Uncharacterized protein n=1 Tax=Geobacillus stearothermophilus TaxID=1422 RepID=A0A150NDP7_GEOSE|nr:hypothetical protein B4114_0244 [Geobacillus stearothermophilus]
MKMDFVRRLIWGLTACYPVFSLSSRMKEKQLFFCISYLQNGEEFINIISVLALNNDEC